MVERAAPGGEGYAIDHFSSKAAKDYFERFDEAFKRKDISYLRAFFNDSYEVDDARGQANWTPEFFDEFKSRRGYDLKANLPALFGKDNADKNSRVLYDYRSTIDELLLEHFTQQWKKWGATKGAMVQNQSHGSPANTLDLYDAVDIPETEGIDILRFKFATSAANVSGKPLASSESCTWLNEHFLSSWGDVKKAIDLYFLGGVNHIFYHSVAYSPKDAPWPGWLFYAAVHFQPNNPQWKDFGTLNNYITRVQSFLQKGRPANDVLLYYPLIDRYSEPGRDLLLHFDGMEKNFEGTAFEEGSKWILGKGYGFDFFSDRQLQRFKTVGFSIQTGSNDYKVILLPANKLISDQSFDKLVELAKAGATVLIYKNLPGDVPGWNDLDNRRQLLQALLRQLSFIDDGGTKKASIGKGQFIISDDLNALMDAANVISETIAEKGRSFIRRKNADGTVYFVDNRSDKSFDDWVTLNTSGKAVALFEPMFGKTGLAKWRKAGDKTEVRLELQPYESVIVRAYNVGKSGSEFNYTRQSSKDIPLKTERKISLQFVDGGPGFPTADTTINNLVSWTELNDAGRNFSGLGRYTIPFEKPVGTSKAYLLDLGQVHETAEVQLNGKRLATLIGPTFKVLIPASELKQSNELVVTVANLMANRISYMDRNNLPWKIFYNTNMPAHKKMMLERTDCLMLRRGNSCHRV